MAEAIAAVSLGASVLSFIDLAGRVTSRLKEFYDSSQDLPHAFRSISDRLPLLLEKIVEIKACCDNGTIDEKRARALKAPVDGCRRQIDALNTILTKSLPVKQDTPGIKKDSRFRLTVKALRSIPKEKNVQKLQQILQEYELAILFYLSDIRPEVNSGSTTDRSTSYYEVPGLAVYKFVPRKTLLDLISQSFVVKTQPGSLSPTTVLIGMGGQGKTQLALEFCRMVKPTHSVFWIDAYSVRSAIQSFERLAYTFSGEKFSSSNSAVDYVLRYLRHLSMPFLVVFDNYDSPSKFENIVDFIPQTTHGKILVSSRHNDSARLGEAIKIPPMTIDEGVELLFLRSGHTSTPDTLREARKIVEQLGGLALALDQTGSYLRARNLPFKSFYGHYEKRKRYILNHTPQVWSYYRQLREDEQKTRLSVCTTLELSLLECGETDAERELYVHFLTVAALLDSASVSQVLFESYYEATSTRSPAFMREFATDGRWDPHRYQDFLVQLSAVSLLRLEDSEGSIPRFSLHPLVADWLKARLDDASENAYALEVLDILISVTDKYNGTNAVLDFQETQSMLAHLSAFCSTALYEACALRSAASFTNFYLLADRIDDAERMLKLVDSSERNYLLGKLYLSKGKYKDASVCLKSAVSQYEDFPGLHHPRTLAAMESLANTYLRQGKLEEAEREYTTILARLTGGNLHEDINRLVTVRRLGSVLSKRKKFVEAEVHLNRALDGFRQLLGETHQFYINTLNDLANHYERQGTSSRAEEMYLQVLAGLEKWRGKQHSETLNAVFNLGLFYDLNGQRETAKLYFVRAFEGWEQVLGPEHPDTIEAAERLGNVSIMLAEYVGAEKALWNAFAASQKTSDLEPAVLAAILHSIGQLCFDQGQIGVAEETFAKILLKFEDSDITEQASITRHVLAVTYEALGQADKAAALYKRAADGYRVVYGLDSQEYLRVAATATNLETLPGDRRLGIGGGWYAPRDVLFPDRTKGSRSSFRGKSSAARCTIM